MGKYYFTKVIDDTFEQSIGLVTDALKKEGFGVLTEIDVKATFKKKLDLDFKKYTILGACNPGFAHKAITAEDKIGTMLPCNVVVQEVSGNKVEVTAVDPMASMQAIENPDLGCIASEVREKLKKVIDSL